MKLVERCPKCDALSQRVIKEVTYSNGTKHHRLECSECGGFIKTVPRADNSMEAELLRDPRWREMSRAQLIGRIVELENGR